MSRFCQWYNGKPEDFLPSNKLDRNPSWVDYQVLGPTLGATWLLSGTKDILPIFINSRGCTYHTRFAIFGMGIDFQLYDRPLPFLEFSASQVINGNYQPNPNQIAALKRLLKNDHYKLIVVLPGEDVLISGDTLDDLRLVLEEELSIPVRILRVAGLSGTNPWIGYDDTLNLIYDYVWDTRVKDSEREGINLFGWKWPSREPNHDVGALTQILNHLDVPINYVLPGGASLEDFRGSLRSRVNLLWCSSYIGSTLMRLEKERGIKIAGRQTPFGFSGTNLWIKELSVAMEDPEIAKRGCELSDKYLEEFSLIKQQLKGKRIFVSGGPGRLMGLLQLVADYEMDLVALALFWVHPNSTEDLEKILQRFPKKPNKLITSPSLYELEDVAKEYMPEVWLGGYQEMHVTKKYNIPFVPITLYIRSHQGFEGCLHLGQKMIQALNGYDFVANPFVIKERE